LEGVAEHRDEVDFEVGLASTTEWVNIAIHLFVLDIFFGSSEVGVDAGKAGEFEEPLE
jgi:hypothetical protein